MAAPQAPTTLEPAPNSETAQTEPGRSRRPAWALGVVVIAVLAVIAGVVIGVRGLLANPVQTVNADGTATLQGTFEPYACDLVSCNGYVQAGARSVFVQFPDGCPPPVRGSIITVNARPALDLGKGSYRATGCV